MLMNGRPGPGGGRRGLPSRPSQDLGARGFGNGGSIGGGIGGVGGGVGGREERNGNNTGMGGVNGIGSTMGNGNGVRGEREDRNGSNMGSGFGVRERGNESGFGVRQQSNGDVNGAAGRSQSNGGGLREQSNGIGPRNQSTGTGLRQQSNGVGRPEQSNGYMQKQNPLPAIPKLAMQDASPKTVLEGYREDIVGGFGADKARFNPMNTSRPQSSPLFNVNDPIQVHLLVETALGDSKEYEILSQEEVDDLKKQCQVLSQRIEQTRQNLTIQSKYRDAAASMTKLYSTSDRKKNSDDVDPKKPRRSLLGHRKNSSASEADLERLTSERKCEELAAELWSLEKRLMEPQSRLLKHTAGILQMTHKGPAKSIKSTGASQQNGIPGSPESIFTYSNARSSMEPVIEENFFDDRSLYRVMDQLGAFGNSSGNGAAAAPGESFRPPPKSQAREHLQMVAKTEQKLEDLNRKLREVIIKVNPARGATYSNPPLAKTNGAGKATDPGEMLQNHLDYLEKSIDTIDKEQAQAVKAEETLEQTVEEVNRELYGLLLSYDGSRPSPPRLDGQGLDQQLRYFQDSIGAVEMELSRAANSNSQISSSQDNAQQMEAVMMGLWDIMQSGEEEMRRKKLERRQTRTAQGLDADEDDSPTEDSDPNEPFSLQSFSGKVQSLYAQATRLKDQKKVLQRQIKQQRELNSKSDATKDAEMLQKVEELERTQALLTRTEKDSDNVRQQLTLVMEKLDEARQQEQLRDQVRGTDESAAVHAAREELEERNKMIGELEEELQELKDDRSIANAETQGKLAESESKIAALTSQITAIESEKSQSDTLAKENEAKINEKEEEIEALNMKLAELQTEVTIARAELDGAYGTRAQRAAEAANPAAQKEIENLTKKNAALTAELTALRENGGGDGDRMTLLKKELEETIEEYEQMTKASVEWEKEREELEAAIDKLRDERADLETQLSDERVRWLGIKSPGVLADGTAGSGGAGQMSTTVLKNEFKKMMRDTRAESQRALRAEQTERRKAEDELRALKKQLGRGKPGLGQKA